MSTCSEWAAPSSIPELVRDVNLQKTCFYDILQDLTVYSVIFVTYWYQC